MCKGVIKGYINYHNIMNNNDDFVRDMNNIKIPVQYSYGDIIIFSDIIEDINQEFNIFKLIENILEKYPKTIKQLEMTYHDGDHINCIIVRDGKILIENKVN